MDRTGNIRLDLDLGVFSQHQAVSGKGGWATTLAGQVQSIALVDRLSLMRSRRLVLPGGLHAGSGEKRTAQLAADDHLVGLAGKELDDAIAALSTHSLRVGLTRDLFASGDDAGPIAQALRWTSTSTALRYGRKLAPSSNASARMLGKLRE